MLEVLSKVMFVLLLILLVINVFAYVLFSTASEPVTFTSLLDKLDKAPTIDLTLDSSVEIFQITSDWGAFNFFKDLINALGAVIGFAVWICTLLINLVIVVGYLLYLLGLSSLSAYV